MKPFSLKYNCIGTTWEIRFWGINRLKKIFRISKKILSTSSQFEKKYSRFIRDSFINKLSKKTGTITVPTDLVNMLGEYKKLFFVSGKKFTPLVADSLSDMGYDDKYSLIAKNKIRPVADFDTVIAILDHNHLYIKKKTLIDLGALGKGYLVEKIKKILIDENIKQFLIDASGDIAYSGNGDKITIGLEHPLNSKTVIGTIDIKKTSMCSSGITKRKWGEYNHIIDPQTLNPAKEILATWVIAKSTVVADALATALFLSPPENYQQNYIFDYLILNKNLKIKYSKGFTANFF